MPEGWGEGNGRGFIHRSAAAGRLGIRAIPGAVETPAGPSPILVEGGVAYDMARVAPTVAQLVDLLPLDASAGVALGRLDRSNCRCSARSTCNA
jgi:fumarylacetoacetate (FAA) hydrolase family protein